MASKPRDKDVPAAEAERQLLRAMCRSQIPRQQIISAVNRLANYAWTVPEHAVVFRAIRRAISVARSSWREVLPAQATRMGFPDVSWSEYLETDEDGPLSPDELANRLVD